MYPILAIGPLQLQTHLLLNLAAGLLVGVGALLRSRRRFPNLGVVEVIDITFYLFCGVAAGALAAAVLPYLLMAPFGRPLPPYWYMGWQNWFGAVAGGTLAGALYCRKTGRPFGWSLDLFAPLLPLALVLVRLGCLLAGDAYGKETTRWPAMWLPDPYGNWAMRYPSQPVDILVSLLLAGVIFAVERRRVLTRQPELAARQPEPVEGLPEPTARRPEPVEGLPEPAARRPEPVEGLPDGFLYWLYVLLFCLQRFYFEFWRADPPQLFGPFTWNHLYCVIGVCLALGVMAKEMWGTGKSG